MKSTDQQGWLLSKLLFSSGTSTFPTWNKDVSHPPWNKSESISIPGIYIKSGAQNLVSGTRHAVAHRSVPEISPEVSHAFAIVKQYDMSKSIFDDFLDDVENNFELVEYDVLAAIERLETPAEDDDDKLVLHTMSGLFERLATWQRSWGLPLRAFQE